jgi:hypothetical protein
MIPSQRLQPSRARSAARGSRKRTGRVGVWLALGWLCAWPAAADSPRRVRLCDELLVTLSGEQLVQYTTTVSPEGLMEIEGSGPIAAAGQTPEALAHSIEIVSQQHARKLLASVSIVRGDSPGCSVVTLPPQQRPEREPIPDLELEIDTAPHLEMELWRPAPAGPQTPEAGTELP